ncbi:MAG: VTC domain-containing protein [Phycisphaerales bacterium]|nr:VTC domain-containing protein [Phycisphaerales bacterium]
MIGHGMHGDLGRLPIGSEEPSWTVDRAHELKFLIDAETARQVAAWAAERLEADAQHAPLHLAHGPIGNRSAGLVTTLCFDTDRLDVLHRTRGHRRRKFRIRRWGCADRIAFEQKRRRGDRTRRRSVIVAESELAILAAPSSPSSWPGHWFHQRIVERGLRPTCLIEYSRAAFAGAGPEGRWQLTLDHDLRCGRKNDYSLAFGGSDPVDTSVEAVLELHFTAGLTLPFKELLRTWRLNPARLSKYRLCMAALGANEPGLEGRVA